MRTLSILLSILALSKFCVAQRKVTIDLIPNTLVEVPFDEYFNLIGQVPDLVSVQLTYQDIPSISRRRVNALASPLVVSGYVNKETGAFSIPMPFLPPSKRDPYAFTINYKRKVADAKIAAIQTEFGVNIRDFIRLNIQKIIQISFVGTQDTKTLIQNLLNKIPNTGETIVPTTGGLLDPAQANHLANQIFVADLFTSVKNQQNSITGIRNVVGQTGGAVGLKNDLLQLFNSSDFNLLQNSKNADIVRFVKSVQLNPVNAAEVIATGGDLRLDGSEKDGGFDGFEKDDRDLIGRKALNYIRYDDLFTIIKAEFHTKHSSQEQTPTQIEQLLRLLPSRCIRLQKELAEIQDHIDHLTSSLAISLVDQVTISGTGSGTLLTRSASRISIDVGAFYAPTIDQLLPYISANIYFRPVNLNTSFTDLRREYKTTWRHRLAAVIGFTPSTINTSGSSSRVSTGVLLNRSLIMGLGYRVTEFARVGFGGLVVKQMDVNPLITADSKFRLTAYVSISIDLSVFKQFSSNFN